MEILILISMGQIQMSSTTPTIILSRIPSSITIEPTIQALATIYSERTTTTTTTTPIVSSITTIQIITIQGISSLIATITTIYFRITIITYQIAISSRTTTL